MLKFDKPTLVTLTAPTASGKSYLLNALTTRGCNRIVSTTTRERREGEQQGYDYDYITEEQSLQMEMDDKFFELITFRGTRYGVTHEEMNGKMALEFAPIVVLEPQGVEIYEKLCHKHGWDIYKVYVHVPEAVRINRLIERTVKDIQAAATTPLAFGKYSETFAAIQQENLTRVIPRLIATHTDRILSITGDERGWSNTNIWDAIVPGDDLNKALEMLVQGATWHNSKRAEPAPYTHV